MSEKKKEKEGYTRKKIMEENEGVTLSQIKKHDEEGILERIGKQGRGGAIFYSPESVEEFLKAIEVEEGKNKKAKKKKGSQVVGVSDKFNLQPVDSGVYLKLEPGVEKIDISDKALKKFLTICQKGTSVRSKERALKSDLKSLQAEAASIAEEYEGLVGLVSEDENINTNIPRVVSKDYVESLLKEGLGFAYYNIVKKVARVTIEVFTEKIAEETLVRGVMQLLLELGVPEEDLDKVGKIERKQDVDEKKLKELEQRSAVSLPEGAVIEDVTRRVTFGTLD